MTIAKRGEVGGEERVGGGDRVAKGGNRQEVSNC